MTEYASQADIGYGTLLSVRSGPDTSFGWVDIAEVGDITPPSDTFDEIEVTHMQSPGDTKEFIAGLSDPGTMSMPINYVPGNGTDEFVLAWKAARQKRDTRITYKSGRTQIFSSFVKTYTPSLPVSGKMTATITLRVAGASTFTDA